jgi:protein tyrosine phosphatase (PTP) superfamily phosphohydrolase (DUF442 family)
LPAFLNGYSLQSVSLDAIRNFVAIDDIYATAGQPTEDQLRVVAEHGFEVVINLGLLDPRYCLPDEAGSVSRLGMLYHHIPVDFQNPTLADLERFCDAMLSARPRKTFVHCAANLRVSCFMSLFGERHLDWTPEQVNSHFRRLWSPNDVWQRFFDHARDAMRSEP